MQCGKGCVYAMGIWAWVGRGPCEIYPLARYGRIMPLSCVKDEQDARRLETRHELRRPQLSVALKAST